MEPWIDHILYLIDRIPIHDFFTLEEIQGIVGLLQICILKKHKLTMLPSVLMRLIKTFYRVQTRITSFGMWTVVELLPVALTTLPFQQPIRPGMPM